MKSRLIWLLLSTLVLIVAILALFRGEEALPIAEGDAIRPAPSGSMIALRGPDGRWAVHDRDGIRLLDLDTPAPPLWLEGLASNALLITKGSALFRVDPVAGTRVLVAETAGPGRTLEPAQALDGARALVTRRDGPDLAAFGILRCREPGEAPVEFFEPRADSGADRRIVRIQASPRGEPVMVTVRDGAYFRSGAFARDESTGAWTEIFTLPDLNHPEVFFSPSGAYLLFSSVDNGVELEDLRRREEPLLLRWPGIASTGVAPLRVFFTRNEHRVYIPLEDAQGYRQIFTFDTLSGTCERFTHGWLDHYGIRLSRDDRYLVYRQGDSPPEPLVGEGRLGEEDLYLYDYPGQRSLYLGERPMRAGGEMTGPCFSGDLKDVYFVAEGRIFRVAL